MNRILPPSILFCCTWGFAIAAASHGRSEFVARIRVDETQKVSVDIEHSLGTTPPATLKMIKRLVMSCADREIRRDGEGAGDLFFEVKWNGSTTRDSVILKSSPNYKSKAVMDCLRSRFNPKPVEPTSTPRNMAAP